MSEPWHNVTYDKTYKMQQTKIDQLERENAGLVDKIGNYQYEVDEGQKTIERLEKENEKLKKIATDADNDFWRMKQIFNVRIAQLEEKLNSLDGDLGKFKAKTGATWKVGGEFARQAITKLKEN